MERNLSRTPPYQRTSWLSGLTCATPLVCNTTHQPTMGIGSWSHTLHIKCYTWTKLPKMGERKGGDTLTHLFDIVKGKKIVGWLCCRTRLLVRSTKTKRNNTKNMLENKDIPTALSPNWDDANLIFFDF